MNYFSSNFNRNSPPSTALESTQSKEISIKVGCDRKQQQQSIDAAHGGVVIGNAPPSSQQNSDIKLLHRLLPGVHIASENVHKLAALAQQGWNNAANPQQ